MADINCGFPQAEKSSGTKEVDCTFRLPAEELKDEADEAKETKGQKPKKD